MSKQSKMQPLVYIIILNWNNAPDTIECIQSLKESEYQSYIPLVVDNGSTNGSVEEILNRFPSIDVIELDMNSGYAAGNNVGIQHALKKDADYVLVLNNDTLVAPNMIGELVNFAQSNPRAGMVGPKMYCADLDDTIYATGSFVEWACGKTTNRGMFQKASPMNDPNVPEPVDFITGCGVLVSRQFVEAVGGIDPIYFLNYEDVDWGVRAWRQGFEVWFVPQAVMWHKVSATLGKASPENSYYMTRNALLFFGRYSTFRNRWMAILWIIYRTLRSIIAWTLKPQYWNESYRKLRFANILALRDFALGHYGQMNGD